MLLMRVLGILVMCSAAGWALALGVEDTASAQLLVTAARLESPGFAAAFDGTDVDSGRALSTCRSAIVHAGVTVLLAEMDRQKNLHELAAWLTARQRAGEMLDHARDCLPSDGGLWARTAQLSLADANWPDALASLGASQRLAPADDDALLARIEVWTNVPATAVLSTDGSLRTDIRVVLGHGRIELVRLLLASAPLWMLPMVHQELGALPPARQRLAEQVLPVLVDSSRWPT